jgi:IS1 family transposase
VNKLPEAKRVQILSCLLEGMAVRATSRVTGVSKGAVLRLIAEVGPACERFHHRFVHDVPCKRLELDEMHQFVYGKSRCLPETLRDNPDYGTIWTWLGITDARLIVSYLVGARDLVACKAFVGDIAYRVRGKVQITTDAWMTYPGAIIEHFRTPLVNFGTVEKEFADGGDSKRPEARYAPGKIRRCIKKVVLGDPDPAHMTTSHCERLNLTVRMQNKRYARLTNAHSKMIAFHRWALAMQVVFYNWCRVNAAVKKTPAQASGLTEYRFTVKDLLRLEMWAPEPLLQDSAK